MKTKDRPLKYGDCEKQLRANNPGITDCEVKRLLGEINSPLARISTYKCLIRGNHSSPVPQSPYAGKNGMLLLADDIEFITKQSYEYICRLSSIESIVKFGREMGADE